MGHAIRDNLVLELTRLGEQKRHYLVAIAVAESSSTLRKHIRTVQRLDDEIAARREVLRGLPVESEAIALCSQEITLLPHDVSGTSIYMSTG